MQLKATTDYAIRTILYLAETQRITSSAEVSEKMGIPRKYLINIIGAMKDAGLIETYSGKKGGYKLGRPAAEISLFDIISVMEGTVRLNRCLEDDRYCSRFATENCPVRKAYVDMQAYWEKYLKGITIENLLKDTDAE